jgi:hypothetical protein
VKASLKVRSIRLASGEEALIALVAARDGRVGWGISFSLDATEARRMAERHAGFDDETPDYSLPA